MNAHQRIVIVSLAVLFAAAPLYPARASTLTIYTTKDAYVDQYVPTQNFGTQPWLRVSNGYGADANPRWGKRTLVWFDLAQIPAGASVQKATLKLYYYAYWDTNPKGRRLECWHVWNYWSEATVNWNNAPANYAYNGAFANVPDSYGWMSWDVTQYVWYIRGMGWSNGGWSIEDPNKWGKVSIPVTIFRSREYGSLVPKLEVTYTSGKDEGADGAGETSLSPAEYPSTTETPAWEEPRPGDLNCDGVVDLQDADPFAAAITDAAAYQAAHPDCPWQSADLNGDGQADLDDLDAFVALLRGDGLGSP